MSPMKSIAKNLGVCAFCGGEEFVLNRILRGVICLYISTEIYKLFIEGRYKEKCSIPVKNSIHESLSQLLMLKFQVWEATEFFCHYK